MIQCRNGSYVIAGRSGVNRSHFLSVVRINGRGEIIGGPKYFGSMDANSGEVGYDLIECHDGAIAVVGLRGPSLAAIVDTRLFDLDLADARGNLAFGQPSVANNQAVPVLILQLSMTIDPLRDFRLDCLSEQSLSAFSKDLRQHVLGLGGWKLNRRRSNFLHGGVLLEMIV